MAGRDKVWSDNSDGSGSNWLGLQLMLRRDELRGGGEGGWAGFIRAAVDLQTGTPRSDAWQCAVRSANADLTRTLPQHSTDEGRGHEERYGNRQELENRAAHKERVAKKEARKLKRKNHTTEERAEFNRQRRLSKAGMRERDLPDEAEERVHRNA